MMIQAATTDSNNERAGMAFFGTTTTANATPALCDSIPIQDGSFHVQSQIVGKCVTTAGEDVAYTLTGCINVAGGTVVSVGTAMIAAIEHANSTGCTVGFGVATSAQLDIAVTGEAATAYGWKSYTTIVGY